MKVLVLLLTAALGGCVVEPPLTNAQPSRHALAGAVLDAIARRDAASLQALALNEEEFRVHVWPGLPAARLEGNQPFSDVWADLRQKSEAALQMVLAMHGGRRYEFLEVRFAGKADSYPGYQIHRQPVFVVGQRGVLAELSLTGSIIEMSGSWKVFSYAPE